MRLAPTRRRFMRSAAAGSLCGLLPQRVFSDAPAAERVTVRLDSEIGLVRPKFHGHFAEHLGSCVFGGLWVGRDSKIPNINGYRKLAIDYLKELGIPVLRWPGGCFADYYHWREGIGPVNKRPKRVNIHWGNYVEDNSFGLARVHRLMPPDRRPAISGGRCRQRHAPRITGLDRVLQFPVRVGAFR